MRRRPISALIALGAKPFANQVGPMELNIPAIEGIGGSVIYLVDRYGAHSIYDVDFVPTDPAKGFAHEGAGLTEIDHVTHNVFRGNMDKWAGFYEKLFNFREIRYFDIEGKLTGLKSRAMTSPDGKIRIPINESSDDKSQIEEYLHTYHGEGIQHIALASDDIYSSVETLQARGVAFQDTPDTYYERLDNRIKGHGEDVDAAEARPHPDGRRADGRPGPAAADLHPERHRADLLRDHPAQGQSGLRRRQFPGAVRIHRSRPDQARSAAGMSAKNWIEFPRIEGEASRQAHADLPDGTFEREIGREGFFGPATHLYHRHPPTGWTSFEGPLRPRAFDAAAAAELDGVHRCERACCSRNAHLQIAHLGLRAAPCRVLARNADGDELLFVHQGEGDLFCDFGHLSYRDGDYILLPRGTMWRLEPKSHDRRAARSRRRNGAYKLPERGHSRPACASSIRRCSDTPKLDDAFRAQADERRMEGRRQTPRRDLRPSPIRSIRSMRWAGKAISASCALNWRDIRPVMSHRYHIPPSVHSTFVADRFVVCTFVPRPIESDPGALKVPFFHSNDDFDEVIFYHAGEFFSRDNIQPGMVTFHPCGFTHGPHPKAFAAGAKAAKTMTDEVAVMIDARDPLDIDEAAEAAEDTGYADSWKTK